VTPVIDMHTRSSVEPFEGVDPAAALTCVKHCQQIPGTPE